MQKFHDKRDRAAVFRTRLGVGMEQQKLSQSALARAAGVDRSTISQLLKAEQTRLPNAQVVAECAAVLGVSADWLLGLTDRPERAADLLAASLTMPDAPRAPGDQQILDWHREAAGYKIRHVPAALPDMLKTRAVLEWEYASHLGRTTSQAIGASQDRLEFMRQSRSDYEIALPIHELRSFAAGTGYYAGLPAGDRTRQLQHFAGLHDQLYPSLRIYLFDARKIYSSPITIFGPLLAVLYLGRNYVAFRDSERIRAFGRHFDHLVREAVIPARSFPDFLGDIAG